jgi:hypothetical protein
MGLQREKRKVMPHFQETNYVLQDCAASDTTPDISFRGGGRLFSIH